MAGINPIGNTFSSQDTGASSALGSSEGLASNNLLLSTSRSSIAGSGHMAIASMDGILDKLKCISYIKEFCRPNNIQPFHKFYFTAPSANPNEQFYHFVLLVSWLMKISHHTFEAAGQFDDPNAVSANIAAELKKLGIPFDYAPVKLKQAYGDAVLYALQSLVDLALVSIKFEFQKPIHKMDDYLEEAEVDNDAEVTTEGIEDNTLDVDDAEEMYMGMTQSVHMGDDKKSTIPIKSKVDPSEWKLEVERVTPMLRIQMPIDNKDWRVHIDQINHYQNTIQTCMAQTQTQLIRLHTEIEKTLEKIGSREKYINTQFEPQIEQYRMLQDQLSGSKQKFGVASSNVSELTSDLSGISEELDNVKSKMDDLGSGMTDSKSLVAIKQGLTQLKTETKQMDLRIGVIEHTLLHAKLKSKGGAIGTDIQSFPQQGLSFFDLQSME